MTSTTGPTTGKALPQAGSPGPATSPGTSPATGQGHGPDEAALAALNSAYVRAVGASDTAWFEANLAPDFENSNPDGTVVSRAAFIAQIAKPSTVKDIAERDVRIRILGDAAYIHAATAYTLPDGKPGRGRYTDIWARRAGRWQCVFAHVTRG
ncbi:MAG: nuclear transport factor 2 family protein [Hyphomicrobiaceae bacterium]